MVEKNKTPLFLCAAMVMILFLIVLFSSCKFNLKSTIKKQIDLKVKDYGECHINLRDITDFDWDNVIFFRPGMSPREIELLLNVKLDNEQDFGLLQGVIFVKNGKIVYEDYILYNPEKKSDFAYWSYDNVSLYKLYTKYDCVIKGKKQYLSGMVHYSLSECKDANRDACK